MISWLFDLFAGIYLRIDKLKPLPSQELTEEVLVCCCGSANFFIYRQGKKLILIDCGFFLPVIRREFRALNLNPAQVSHIFLTHSDFDHRGGLKLFPQAEVYLSRQEEVMVNGTLARKYSFIKNRPIPHYRPLADGERIEIDGLKVTAIAAPGHTPGSMVYLFNDSLLFSGDAFALVNGKARPTGPYYNMDRQASEISLGKLASLPGIKQVFTAHWGYSGDYGKAMSSWRQA